MGRHGGSGRLLVAAGCAAALWAASTQVRSFVAVPPSTRPPASGSPPAVGIGGDYTSARAASEGAPFQAAALLAACGVLAAAAAARGRRGGPAVACRAEGVFSIFDSVGVEEDDLDKVEQEMGAQDYELTDDEVDGYLVEDNQGGTEQDRGSRQISYTLYPSRQYVLYIAKKNAERNWTKDGPDGRNKGCMEVQIAVLTERIRSMILHVREFKRDYKCRMKLVQLVARRRRLLDKLSWKDLDSYLHVREELKIRHVYRMEALIGRLPAYRYSMQDRKHAPGRRTAMRLKKTKRLLTGRLAKQLKQGRSRKIIHKTQSKINSRQWAGRDYDEAKQLIQGRAVTPTMDPLNMP